MWDRAIYVMFPLKEIVNTLTYTISVVISFLLNRQMFEDDLFYTNGALYR